MTTVRLRHGDHACAVHGSSQWQRRRALDFMREGLAAGDRVCYFAGDSSLPSLSQLLEQPETPLARAVAEGRLVVTTAEQSYLAAGRFEADRMIDGVRKSVDEALEAGFAGVRFAGEMDWIARERLPLGELVDYEYKVSEFYASRPAAGLCHYDSRLFDPVVLAEMRNVHPVVLLEPREEAAFEFSTEPLGLRIDGEVDVANHEALRRALETLEGLGQNPGAGDCHLELTGLSFMDIGGVHQLVQFARRFRGGRVVLRRPPTGLLRVATILDEAPRWELTQ
jgi:hypothetical protein